MLIEELPLDGKLAFVQTVGITGIEPLESALAHVQAVLAIAAWAFISNYGRNLLAIVQIDNLNLPIAVRRDKLAICRFVVVRGDGNDQVGVRVHLSTGTLSSPLEEVSSMTTGLPTATTATTTTPTGNRGGSVRGSGGGTRLTCRRTPTPVMGGRGGVLWRRASHRHHIAAGTRRRILPW